MKVDYALPTGKRRIGTVREQKETICRGHLRGLVPSVKPQARERCA